MQEEPNRTETNSHDYQESTDDVDDDVFELLPAIAERLRLGTIHLAVRLCGGEAFLPCTFLVPLRRRLCDLCARIVRVEDLLPLAT